MTLQVHFNSDHIDSHKHLCDASMCALEFRDESSLRIHRLVHTVEAARICRVCGDRFPSVISTKSHLLEVHANEKSYLQIYNEALENIACLCSSDDRVNGIETAVLSVVKKREKLSDDIRDKHAKKSVDIELNKSSITVMATLPVKSEVSNTQQQSKFPDEMATQFDIYPDDGSKDAKRYCAGHEFDCEGHYSDQNYKFKCHRCRVGFFKQNHLTAHNQMLRHQRGDKLRNTDVTYHQKMDQPGFLEGQIRKLDKPSHPEDKYLDPERPFKCEVCRESFTQKNILLVHFNSVSHLHKLRHSDSKSNTAISSHKDEQISRRGDGLFHREGARSRKDERLLEKYGHISKPNGYFSPGIDNFFNSVENFSLKDEIVLFKKDQNFVSFKTDDIHQMKKGGNYSRTNETESPRNDIHQMKKGGNYSRTNEIESPRNLYFSHKENDFSTESDTSCIQSGYSSNDINCSAIDRRYDLEDGNHYRKYENDFNDRMTNSFCTKDDDFQRRERQSNKLPDSYSKIMNQIQVNSCNLDHRTASKSHQSIFTTHDVNNSSTSLNSFEMTGTGRPYKNFSESVANGDRPYKCAVCKMSYSQKATLDIHLRSVYHHSSVAKSARNQVTAIQETQRRKNNQQHADNLDQPTFRWNEYLSSGLQVVNNMDRLPASHKSINGGVVEERSTREDIPNAAKHCANTHTVDEFKVNTSFQKLSTTNAVTSLPVDFMSPAGRFRWDLTYQQMSNSSEVSEAFNFKNVSVSSEQMNEASLRDERLDQVLHDVQDSRPTKSNTLQALLESIGFECVMHFNELNHLDDSQPPSSTSKIDSLSCSSVRSSEGSIRKRNREPSNDEELEMDESRKKVADIPELSQSICPACTKEFSSIWVLKTHLEEIHGKAVPDHIVEEFAIGFRSHYERKGVELPGTPLSCNPPTSPPDEKFNNYAKLWADEKYFLSQHNQALSSSSEMKRMTEQLMQQLTLWEMAAIRMVPMTMNLAPPLMSMMMPFSASEMEMYLPQFPPPVRYDAIYSKSSEFPSMLSGDVQQLKRARTRITDDQLNVLRTHFDISNSPSDEEIREIALETSLPQKVIKHWFRNTLFKERQRCKDSPYNFSIPPLSDLPSFSQIEDQLSNNAATEQSSIEITEYVVDQVVKPKQDQESDATGNESEVSLYEDMVQHSASSTPKSSLTSSLSFAGGGSGGAASDTTGHMGTFGQIAGAVALASGYMTSSDVMTYQHQHHHHHGKRANRTHFTDQQIHVLQEHFEQNAYPKDDELESLSRQLDLSPRVIIVWFQNARQKARKIYENQPVAAAVATGAVDALTTGEENGAGSRNGLKYQCPDCSAVFQRYYELIKHQRSHSTTVGNKDTAGSIQSSLLVTDAGLGSVSNIGSGDGGTCGYGSREEGRSSIGLSKHSDLTVRHLSGVTEIQMSLSTEKSSSSSTCDFPFDKSERQTEWTDGMIDTASTSSPDRNVRAFNLLQDTQTLKPPQKSEVKENSNTEKLTNDEGKTDQGNDRRMRTTILPHQLEYLTCKYKSDCNPSRKQLNAIAAEVGLKKRVVQVWFQNTRARERKGHYRTQIVTMDGKRQDPYNGAFTAHPHTAAHHSLQDTSWQQDTNTDSDMSDCNRQSQGGVDGRRTAQSPGGATSSNIVDFAHLVNNPYNLFTSAFAPAVLPPALPFYSGGSSDAFFGDFQSKSIFGIGSSSSATAAAVSDSPRFQQQEEASQTPLDLRTNRKVLHVDSTDVEKNVKGISAKILSGPSGGDESQSESHSELMESGTTTPTTTITDGGPPSTARRPPFDADSNFPNKRHRTHMSSLQIRVMRAVYADYKTPTIAECEALGREIGLRKRVVQVWFQNARAKEKKHRTNNSESGVGGPELETPSPSDCAFCLVKYSEQLAVRDHIFTEQHIDAVKKVVRSQGAVSPTSSPDDPTPHHKKYSVITLNEGHPVVKDAGSKTKSDGQPGDKSLSKFSNRFHSDL